MKKTIILTLVFVAGIYFLLHLNIGGLAGWAGKEYMPRKVCMYGENNLIKVHLISDWLISISYATIPISLIWLAIKRKDLMQGFTFTIFACFILFCGITHIMDIISINHTYYRWDAIFKVCCAISSIGAAVTFPFVVIKIRKMPLQKAYEEMTTLLKETEKKLSDLKQTIIEKT